MEFNPEFRKEVGAAMSKHYIPGRGCWEATCYRHPSGHAMVRIPAKYVAAEGDPRRPRYMHRVMYEVYVGEIPPGAVLHHVCENPGCVKPRHLELIGDVSDHRLHHIADHCINGHPFDPENTWIETVRDNARGKTRQRRRCRRCLADKARRYRAAKKENNAHG